MFIDSHAHYDMKQFDQNRWQLLAQCKRQNIGKILIPAVSIESNQTMIEKLDYNHNPLLLDEMQQVNVTLGDLPDLYFSAGVHPTRVWDGTEEDYSNWERLIREAATRPGFVAIGETGLDNHKEMTQEMADRQEKWFHSQLAIAEDLKLPLVLHIRGMNEEAIQILRQYKLEYSGVVHCANSIWDYTKEYLDMGLYIGVGGSMTSEQFPEFRESLKIIPLNRIMMETDAPYVKPAWCTDQVNTSLTIPRMAEELACIKGIELEEVERVTTENAEKVFLAKVANPSDIRQP